MIISRTPFRLSFFGGGTDYPAWYLKRGGNVLSVSIDKYCYITCRALPPFFEHRYRIVWSKIETCKDPREIQHVAVRETLAFLGLRRSLEIHHDGDLPARSGMGSSSSFTVGLLHALYAFQGIMPSKRRLATESIYIEQCMIRDVVGSQDQVCVAHGGLNRIDFCQDGQIDVRPVILSRSRLHEFNSHLMLFYTGIGRTASSVAANYVPQIERKADILTQLQDMVPQAVDSLTGSGSICRLGELLHETWVLKKKLAAQVSNDVLDELYARARAAGALGGKITGAGGGGFLLLFVPPAAQGQVREALAEKILVPFRFESGGSQIIFYDPDDDKYQEAEKDQDHRTISAFQELDTLGTGSTVKLMTRGCIAGDREYHA